ncbi:thioredoxin-1 [Aplysia californica]|uniref:Thioredoxin n=1 Tax=Aplysia californica TaxID=6500 RepID=A0ABM0JRY6_APLCA|nr:thioredoxin-1 [Aplysia californica]
MRVIETKEEFDNLISSEKKLVVIDFFATWCGPCKVIAPFLEKLSEKYPDVVIVKIDVDENADTAEECDVTAMPTIQLFRDGSKVQEVIGANQSKIEEAIVANK